MNQDMQTKKPCRGVVLTIVMVIASVMSAGDAASQELGGNGSTTVPIRTPAHPPTVQTVVRFRPPMLLESIVRDRRGNIFVSNLFGGVIYKISHSGKYRPFYRVALGKGPGLRGLFCMVFDNKGGLYFTVNSPDSKVRGVWHVTRGGRGALFAALPADVLLNGITRDGHGHLLIADSKLGRIWQVDMSTAKVRVWLQDKLLAPHMVGGEIPGANGIQRHAGFVYVTNTSASDIVRVPILPDGAAGKPEIAIKHLAGDDFGIDGAGNLYITTHPFNTIVKIAPNGVREAVASAADGVIGPSAVSVSDDGKTIYVAMDGGLFPLPGHKAIPVSEQRPSVMKLSLHD